MAGTRRVQYASVANLSGGKTEYTSAETRDQLYAEFPEMELLSKGMKAFIKGATPQEGYPLSSGSSKLPEGDFVLYFLVDKNDSGK